MSADQTATPVPNATSIPSPPESLPPRVFLAPMSHEPLRFVPRVNSVPDAIHFDHEPMEHFYHPPPPPRPWYDYPPPPGHFRQGPPRGPVRFADRESDMDSFTEGGDSDSDLVSVTSSELPDRKEWNPMTADESTKVIYEAWEVLSMDDSYEWSTWKKFLGMRFGVTYESLGDGFLTISPLSFHTQEELALEVQKAAREHKKKNPKEGAKSYEQDLADRAYALPTDIYNRLQRLINSKLNESNKNPHRVRDWDIVLLREEEQAITRLTPNRKGKGLMWWKKKRPAMDRWFLIVRGEETKYLKEGWQGYTRISNPWWKVDKVDNQQDERLRQQNKREPNHLIPRRDVRRSATATRRRAQCS